LPFQPGQHRQSNKSSKRYGWAKVIRFTIYDFTILTGYDLIGQVADGRAAGDDVEAFGGKGGDVLAMTVRGGVDPAMAAGGAGAVSSMSLSALR